MSMRALSESIEPLPFALTEQVMSYARSLETAAPDIFRDAGVKPTRDLTNTLVFIAGLRKLFSIVDSNFWVIDNTGAILSKQKEQYNIRVGGTDLSRGGDYYHALSALRKEFIELLEKNQLLQYMRNMPYSEVLRELAGGR